MTILLSIANGVSAVAAFTAAFLWWKASRVSVPPEQHGSLPQLTITALDGTRMNPFATALESSRLNARAAIAAAVAALFQAVALLLTMAGC